MGYNVLSESPGPVWVPRIVRAEDGEHATLRLAKFAALDDLERVIEGFQEQRDQIHALRATDVGSE